MAVRWHPRDIVNKSCNVTSRPRRCLAARRQRGHSVPDRALDGPAAQAKRAFLNTAWRVPGRATALIIGILGGLPMSDAVKVGFVPFSTAARGILVVFCDDTLKFGAETRKALGAAADVVKRAADSSQFKGKSGSTLDILAPQGLKVSRLIVIGAGKLSALKDNDFLKLGGAAAGKLRAGSDAVTMIVELPSGAVNPEQAAAVASCIRRRAYKFDRDKTKKKDGEDAALRAEIWLAVGDVGAARKAFAPDG